MITEVPPSSVLHGEIRTPGDKSISHRSILISALAAGASVVTGCSNGDDVSGTLAIVQKLGARVDYQASSLEIEGPEDGLRASVEALDCGNSGTTIRLLTGVVGSIPGRHTLTGDASLQRRPMDRVAQPLALMGLSISGNGERVLPPLVIDRSDLPLRGISYDVPVPSAQVKSAVLFAALAADSATIVSEAVRTRANTEEMLAAAGVLVVSESVGAGRRVTVTPSRPKTNQWTVPGDPSQAAFFVVGGVLHREGRVCVSGIYGGVERLGYLAVLQRMGANIDLQRRDDVVNIIASSSDLSATTVDAREIPSVDEVPILAIAAAAATGTTTFVDVGELRIKESDRLLGTITLVNALGARAHADGDNLFVTGVGSAQKFQPFDFASDLDHRMVMSAAIAGICGRGAVVSGAETVTTSYPRFFDDLASLR